MQNEQGVAEMPPFYLPIMVMDIESEEKKS